jgi:cellulose synthase/poly-beta-1,6-N-acetylglucosamine synthase-like glycosyltransferase
VFLPDHVAPAELPVEMNAFKSQQHRWAKGSIQTFLKLMPTILRSNQPLHVKAEAFFHLSANFNYPLMCVLSVLMAPSMVIRYNMGWYEMLLIDVPLFFAATASVANFYMVCQRELHKDWMTRLKYLPFLMSIGIGLAVNNTKAVFEAIFNRESEFARTPKYRIEGRGDEWIGKKYRQNFVVQPIIELALGLYFTATVFYALANGIYGTLPFLVLFQVGFLYTGLLSIVQQFGGDDMALRTQAAGE